MWALIPETIEYGEYKTGKRMGGLIYAIIGFFFKFGMALGGCTGFGSRSVWICGKSGANAGGIDGILITTTIIPVFLLVLAMIDINFYNLDEKKYKSMVRELENRDKVYLDHIDDFKA
ncbi:MFS transporter [Bacillus velezensis]|nr:MFS transporter [Bacillus velezensis]